MDGKSERDLLLCLSPYIRRNIGRAVIMSVASRIAGIFGVGEDTVIRYFEQGEKVEKYIQAKLGGMDLWALTPDKRLALFAIVKLLKPDKAVETGVGPGSSTTTILSAIGSGTLHSIDFGVKYGNEEETYPVGFVVPDRLKSKWHLHIGDSAKLLKPLLEELGTIEMFYHDSTHSEEHVQFEISNAWNHMDRGIILIDNYLWTHAPRRLSEKVKSPLVELSRKAGGFCAIPKHLGD